MNCFFFHTASGRDERFIFVTRHLFTSLRYSLTCLSRPRQIIIGGDLEGQYNAGYCSLDSFSNQSDCNFKQSHSEKNKKKLTLSANIRAPASMTNSEDSSSLTTAAVRPAALDALPEVYTALMLNSSICLQRII